MATSSSNKMPLLVDRPMHSYASIGSQAAITDSTDLNTPTGAGCTLIIDCSANDGAIVDSLSIIANEASTTASTVLAFLSVAATKDSISDINTVVVASATIGSTAKGERTNIPLPPLCVPVPNLGGTTSATETDKKNTGLYIPSGGLLYVGLDVALSSPNTDTRVHVFAQGGFF